VGIGYAKSPILFKILSLNRQLQKHPARAGPAFSQPCQEFGQLPPEIGEQSQVLDF
jgi:hypothetical protein